MGILSITDILNIFKWNRSSNIIAVMLLLLANETEARSRVSCELFCIYICAICRVTTCLENLEMSGNLTAVGEISDFTKSQGK